ncbi:MAG: RHS repeat domain-containing protein [Verrucomicrobiota bacterium]
MRNFIFGFWFVCILPVAVFAQSEQVVYTYDNSGRLTGAYTDNGTSVTYVYDAAGNLLRRKTTVIVDSDGDFMDDTFEMSNFGSLSRDGTADFDFDGQSDLAEFYAGTDPDDSTSVLNVTSSSDDVSGFTITWAAVSGKRYRVQYKDHLNSPAWFDLAGDVTASGASASKVDTRALTDGRRFYRIIVMQ